MHSVVVGNKTLSLPSLVPSISSFETQLDPLPALQLQQTLREPISLVSAYDIRSGNEQFLEVCQEYQKSAVLLLDSGGYEDSRVRRYAGDGAPSWTFDDFKTVCDLNIYDFAFSYDYFWCDEKENEVPSDFELRLVGDLPDDHKFVPAEKLIPVVHLQTRDGKKRLDEQDILNLVARMSSECISPFIAIPERELGEGLLDRFNLAKKICDQITEANANVSLHLLGCGNPLSFAFMSVAGVKMADGLEWYRTFAADNFHLHHFQQEPIFESARNRIYNPTADFILSMDAPYRIKTATLNLMSFQAFLESLSSRLPLRTVYELITEMFGTKAGSALRAVEV